VYRPQARRRPIRKSSPIQQLLLFELMHTG
jgi:hypothetical protein